MRLAGYLPKRIRRPSDWLHLPTIVEVCSVSSCISPVADANARLRNALDLYDSPELARSAATGEDWRLFAYKVLPIRYDERGCEDAWPWPAVAPTPLPSGFRSIGFDVVNDATEMEIYFPHACSPLSCNGAAERWPVNAHCLLDSLDVAIAAARRFANDEEPVEPGPYFVVEVLSGE